jgi:hypothetical protein
MAATKEKEVLMTNLRFKTDYGHVGVCSGKRGPGVGSIRRLRFPLPILFPPSDPHSLISLLLTLLTASFND